MLIHVFFVDSVFADFDTIKYKGVTSMIIQYDD